MKKSLRELVLPPHQCPLCKKFFIESGGDCQYLEEKDIVDKASIKEKVCADCQHSSQTKAASGSFSAIVQNPHWKTPDLGAL